MIMGLVSSTPSRLPNSWQYGLQGLAELEALFGLAQTAQSQIPPIGICADGNGNIIDCGQAGGGGGNNPCDPSIVQTGYSCYVGADGTVTYVPAGGSPPPKGSPTGSPQGSPTGGPGGTPGGTGSNSNAPCLGIFGMTAPGQWICNHKTLLLILGIAALVLVAGGTGAYVRGRI